MTETQNQKTEFVSPLNQFIKQNCEKCPNWNHPCSTYTQQGTDTMFLCMCAANLQTPNESDPQKIMQDAQAILKSLVE